MAEAYAQLRVGQTTILTPHGAFRITNPSAIIGGWTHLLRYWPHDQWATIVAITFEEITK